MKFYQKTHNSFFKLKRKCITLIEIMIVMFLIALIAGVVTYNYRGSLDEGKAFKTQAAIDRVETILNLNVSEDPSLLQDLSSTWMGVVAKSPLVKNAKDLTHDGWGYELKVNVDDSGIHVYSPKLDEYKNKNATLFKK